jgi:uncharacterized protein (TIGR03382 family)
MLRTVSLAAVAALAGAASAQSITVDFQADRATATLGEAITWTVTASFTDGFYLQNFNARFLASNSALAQASTFTYASTILGNNALGFGIASGATLNDVRTGQALLFGAIDSANPIVVGSFTTTAADFGALSYALTKGTISASAALSIQSTTGGPFGTIVNFNPGDTGFNFTSSTVNIIPAPGALALLGLGGLAAARRRR